MAEVSIIVPVYQVEKYIRQCVDSILAQTFTDFELILVDDGSKDMSGQICDEYAGMDERVKVIHKENGGAADTRNRGMEQAIGNYFMFVDSDDYIAPTMVECLYKNILNENADIAACNYLYLFENDRKKDFVTNAKSEVLTGTEIFYDRKNERNYGFWTVVWNKLMKRETVGKIRFRSGKYYEDEFWANEIYQMDIKIVTVPECLYYYRQHENSTMRQKKIARSLDLIEAYQERIYIYLKEQKYAEQAYKVLVYSLEHLEESKRLITNEDERKKYIQAENRTKDIVNQLKKRKLSGIQSVSLVFLGISPCLVFSVGIKFRGLLERFL
ncbi:MAG: glycosyltransferase [Oliverpabstia sp.]